MGNLKDVLLVGVGAVGAIYSLILKKSGQVRVTVVARSNYEVIITNGLHIQSRKYGDLAGWKPDSVVPSIAHALDRPYAYVVLTTKALPEIARTPSLLKPLLSSPYADTHPQPTYVIMQNGLNVEVDLYNALKELRPNEEPRIISTAVWIGTRLVGKRLVEHNEFDRVAMGVYRPTKTATTNTPEEAALLAGFADILKAGGSQVTIVPEIQRIKYTKNFWNIGLGAAAALSRLPLPAIFRPPHLDPNAPATAAQELPPPDGLRTPSQVATAAIPAASPTMRDYTIPLLYDALMEVYAIGTRLFPPDVAGPGLDPNVVMNTLLNTARLHARPDSTHRPSMLVDAELGRPMEVEVVVGEVLRMGREVGVAMPRIETIYALLLIIQNQLLRVVQ